MEPVARATLRLRSPAATHALGASLGRALRGGESVALTGPLGAGKTAFVKGVAFGLGIAADEVSSPTFALVQTYSGRLTLHHADLYRLATAAELYATGFFDLFAPDVVVAVEWSNRIAGAMPPDAVEFSFRHEAGDVRQLGVSAAPGSWVDGWLQALSREQIGDLEIVSLQR